MPFLILTIIVLLLSLYSLYITGKKSTRQATTTISIIVKVKNFVMIGVVLTGASMIIALLALILFHAFFVDSGLSCGRYEDLDLCVERYEESTDSSELDY